MVRAGSRFFFFFYFVSGDVEVRRCGGAEVWRCGDAEMRRHELWTVHSSMCEVGL